VVLDRAGADEQPGTNLRIRQALARHPRVGEAAQAVGVGLTRWLTDLTTAGPSAGLSQSSSEMNKKTGPAGG
jgi:hypothetical protein